MKSLNTAGTTHTMSRRARERAAFPLPTVARSEGGDKQGMIFVDLVRGYGDTTLHSTSRGTHGTKTVLLVYSLIN